MSNFSTSASAAGPTLDELRPRAEAGDAKAQYEMGAILALRGDKDADAYVQAAEWYQRAAENGHVRASRCLGELYLWGKGVPVDGQKAESLLRYAEQKGDQNAGVALAWLDFFGVGREKNVAQGYSQLEAVAQKGFVPAQLELGNIYRTGEFGKPKYAQALRWYRHAADHGKSPEGMFRTGYAYMNAQGCKKDVALALKYFRKAAELDNHPAKTYLGWMAWKGEGMRQDIEQARTHLKEAADQGNTWAQFLLGVFYENGIGVRVDRPAAEAWYRKSARNYDRAKVWLWLNTEDSGHDFSETHAWVARGAREGDETDAYHLGMMYELGRGEPKDVEEAAVWYRRAADAGLTAPAKRLAKMGL